MYNQQPSAPPAPGPSFYPPIEKPTKPPGPPPSPYPYYPNPPPPGPGGYPPLEKPTRPPPIASTYNYYPNPPQPSPSGYPPQYEQQPQVVAGVPVGINDPRPPQLQTPQAQQTGYWSTGLCDCFSDVSSCCLVCWCPCVAFGQLSEIIDKGTSSCGCNGTLYMLLFLLGGAATVMGVPLSCQWIYSCTYRGKLKHDMNMPPSCCEECCIHFWCEPCALCQEYRELQNRGYVVPLGWFGNQERRRQQAGNGTPAMVTAPAAPSMTR